MPEPILEQRKSPENPPAAATAATSPPISLSVTIRMESAAPVAFGKTRRQNKKRIPATPADAPEMVAFGTTVCRKLKIIK